MTALLEFSRIFASCTSLFMLLSPAPMVYKIHKDQHSGVMSIVPLVAVLVNSHMWMMYGYLDNNYFPVFATFLAGDIFLCFFIGVFYRWTANRRKAHRVFAVGGVAMALMSLYAVLAGLGYTGQTHQGVANTAGALSAMTGTIMYASPLEKIFHVFKYKSAAFIPIHLICAGAINNTAWVLFACVTGKYIILVPSFFALTGNLFQVVLYFFVFNPKTHPLIIETAKDPAIGPDADTTDAPQLEVVIAPSPSSTDHHVHGGFHALSSPSIQERDYEQVHMSGPSIGLEWIGLDGTADYGTTPWTCRLDLYSKATLRFVSTHRPHPSTMTIVLQIFRYVAACSSLFMLLSPTPMVYKMHKERDTGVMSMVPLLAVLVNANMWMMYGYLDENYVPVFVTFVAGDLIALTYVVVYYRWTKDRASVHRVMAIAGGVILVTSLYVILGGLGFTGQTRHAAAQVAGIMGNVTGLFMYGSPLVKIVQVFKHKSAVFIPIHMVCMGATNNLIWITYSTLVRKWLILIPSSCAFCISIFQVILYFFVYNPRSHPLPDDYPGVKLVTSDHAAAEAPLESVVIESPHAMVQKTDFVALHSTRSSTSGSQV